MLPQKGLYSAIVRGDRNVIQNSLTGEGFCLSFQLLCEFKLCSELGLGATIILSGNL